MIKITEEQIHADFSICKPFMKFKYLICSIRNQNAVIRISAVIKITEEQIHADFAEKRFYFFINQINSICRHRRAFPCRFYQLKSSVSDSIRSADPDPEGQK